MAVIYGCTDSPRPPEGRKGAHAPGVRIPAHPKTTHPRPSATPLGVRDVLDRVLDATRPRGLPGGRAQGPDLWARHLVSRSDRVRRRLVQPVGNVPDEVWRSHGRAAGPLRNARMARILAGAEGPGTGWRSAFWMGARAARGP